MTQQNELHDSGGSVDTLARTYTPALRRYFQRRVLEHADIDDLVQEVFFRLARRGDFKDVDNLEGYIFQLASNLLRDRLRQRFSHQVSKHEPLSEQQVEDAAFSPERVLQGREALDRLSAAILSLPERTQQVFVCCRIEGLSYVEVSKRLCISLSTVSKHMDRAMDHLMEIMREDLS